MLMLKKLSLSLLFVVTTFSLVGCGSGETSYSLADLQQLADTNASNNESPKDIKTALGHLKSRYGLDVTDSTALIDLDMSDSIVYTTVHKNFEIVDGVVVIKNGVDTPLGEYEVKIVATDTEGKTLEKTITLVVVGDISLIPPVITSVSFAFRENTTGDVHVAYETLGKGKISSFVFAGGVDDARFSIDTTGLLRLKQTVDFEDATAQKLFEIQLQVTDDLGNKSPIQPLLISIKDVDEKYHFISQNNFTVLDNHAEVGKVTAVANDVSMPSAEYGFTETTTTFGIGLTSGMLRFANPVTYVDGGNNTYTVTVQAKNQYNGSKTNSALLTIVVVPDYTLMKPIIDNYESTVTTIPTQEVIVHVSAHSQAPDGNVTFALVGEDAGLFDVDSLGNVRFTVVEDFYHPRDADGNNIFKFAVEVTEDYGNTEPTQEIVVTLIEDPAKKKPIITTTSVDILENTLGHASVAFDRPGTGVVNEYIVVDGTLGSTSIFKFENGFLSFKDVKPDFEAGQSYSVTLRVKDSFNNISEPQVVTVNIVDADETYNFTSQSSFSPTEGDSAVGTITVSPVVEITGAVPTFSIATQKANGTNTNKFQINANTGVLSFTTATDFNDVGVVYTLTINVQSQYQGSTTTSSQISVTVLALSRAITFTPQSAADVPEGITTPPVPIRATSSDPLANITYAMQAGTDTTIFDIDASTGDMIIHVPLYKWSSNPAANVYRGTVVASDQFGNSKVQQGEMHVLKPFDAHPSFVDTTFTINENTTAVATVQATTPITQTSPAPAMRYSIVGGADSSFFSIDNVSGALSFNNIANYEYQNTYALNVEATDSIGHPESVTQVSMVVTVNNVNDAPSNTRFNDGTTATTAPDGYRTCFFFVCSEHNRVTYKQLTATASPSVGTLTYSIKTNPNSNIFSMTSSGNLKIDAPYDHAVNYSVEVQVSESDGEVASRVLTVNLVDND